MDKVFVRAPFAYDAVEASDFSAVEFLPDSSLTHQSFKEECDINTIMRRFAVTGELPDNIRVPQYQEFDGVFDFQTAMNLVRTSQEAFEAMPATVRDRFNNDPARFMDFVNDADNYDEALKMGIVNPRPKPVETPAPAPVEAPPSTSST